MSRSFLFALAFALPLAACNGGSAPVDTATCSSGSMWTGGNEESELMNPGQACIECHSQDEGPRFTAAGTVMGASHDPDDCNGVEGVTVRLTDADGVVHEATTNAAGNFDFRDAIAMPYTAEIESDAGVVAMSGAQNTGDCATCHTADGANGAPGRIVAP